MVNQESIGHLSTELSDLLRNLEAEKRAKVEALFETALGVARERRIIDLWEQPELASTYWILLISGINEQAEVRVAETLLKWKAFFAKDSTALLCVQSSDRDIFRCCSTTFKIRGYPTLLLGKSSDMLDYIKFDPQIVLTLAAHTGSLQRFLTTVQDIVENGGTLDEVSMLLREGRFWSDLQLAPADVIDFITHSAGHREYDVFLSHNSKDKQAVRRLAKGVRERGFKVWLDETELIPGRPWQESLEQIIGSVRTAAILIGKDGLGPWEIPEMRGCLLQFVERHMPVIPVLLPGVSKAPELPLFLKEFMWVDLRRGLTKAGIERLGQGIRGKTSQQMFQL
jgi:hypothetical protein